MDKKRRAVKKKHMMSYGPECDNGNYKRIVSEQLPWRESRRRYPKFEKKIINAIDAA